MAIHIHGTTVNLHQRTIIGTNDFNEPIFQDVIVAVDNVLIGEPTTDDITTSVDLYGKHLAYVLGIPKGDENDWTDTIVEFWGHKFHTYGDTVQGIEENIPLLWNKKVRVEEYE